MASCELLPLCCRMLVTAISLQPNINWGYIVIENIDWSYLLVGGAILIALLSLWAQLWFSFGSSRGRGEQVSATLGLFWIYMAIAIAMLGFGLLLVGKYWEGSLCFDISELSFGFLMTAFIMGLANIFQSTVSVFSRGKRNKTAFDPLFEHPPELNRRRLLKLVGLASSLLLVSYLGVSINHWFWSGYLLILGFAIYEYQKLMGD